MSGGQVAPRRKGRGTNTPAVYDFAHTLARFSIEGFSDGEMIEACGVRRGEIEDVSLMRAGRRLKFLRVTLNPELAISGLRISILRLTLAVLKLRLTIHKLKITKVKASFAIQSFTFIIQKPSFTIQSL